MYVYIDKLDHALDGVKTIWGRPMMHGFWFTIHVVRGGEEWGEGREDLCKLLKVTFIMKMSTSLHIHSYTKRLQP